MNIITGRLGGTSCLLSDESEGTLDLVCAERVMRLEKVDARSHSLVMRLTRA